MAEKNEGRERFLREVMEAIEKGSEDGSASTKLRQMHVTLFDSMRDHDMQQDPLFVSALDSVMAVFFARDIVDIVASEPFNKDRPMADTRLNAIVAVSGAMLAHTQQLMHLKKE